MRKADKQRKKGQKSCLFYAVTGIWFSAFALALGLGVIALAGPDISSLSTNQQLQPTATDLTHSDMISAQLGGQSRGFPVPRKTLRAPLTQKLTPESLSVPTSAIRQIELQITPTSTPPSLIDEPNFAPFDPRVIGYSVEGRPLHVYHFGTGPDIRVIIAGIHGGNEWNTVALADALMIHLRKHPELIPPEVTLYILRALNPDGLVRARGVDGRANANGVDLNRNWPVNWVQDYDPFGCWVLRPITAGTGPASEPETQALMAFLSSLQVTALMSYHSAALGIFPGGLEPHLPSIDLAEAIAAVSSYPYPPYDTGCEYTGTLVDWTADAGIASLDIELHNHQQIDFAQNLRILNVLLNWKYAGP